MLPKSLEDKSATISQKSVTAKARLLSQMQGKSWNNDGVALLYFCCDHLKYSFPHLTNLLLYSAYNNSFTVFLVPFGLWIVKNNSTWFWEELFLYRHFIVKNFALLQSHRMLCFMAKRSTVETDGDACETLGADWGVVFARLSLWPRFSRVWCERLFINNSHDPPDSRQGKHCHSIKTWGAQTNLRLEITCSRWGKTT